MLLLGVDGGQSSTTALIGDETGRVLGWGTGGPCNHVGAAEGREKFTRAVSESVSRARASAGLDAVARFDIACLGFSGGAEDKRAILDDILPAKRILVTTDAVIALAGATAGRPGIIVIGGTGSIAFGRNAAGQFARAGGWGYIFGDEGGAFDLVRQALRAVLRNEEGWGPATALRQALLDAAAAKSANELLHRFYTTEFPRSRVATFARLVDEAARAGDAVAAGLLRKAAADLAHLSSAVRRQLFRPGETAHVAWIGGVFRSAGLLEQFRALVAQEEGNEPGPPVYGPAAGALLEACHAAGLSVSLSHVPEVK